RPILVERCQECHNAEKNRGNLRLDSRAAMMSSPTSSPAVVPHKPDESRLIAVLSHKEIVKMPPKQKLKDEEIAVLVERVKMGAPWPDLGGTVRTTEPGKGFKVTTKDRAFWSFRPVANPSPPKVRDAAWAKTPLDQFILAGLESNNLRPVDAADR